MIINIKQPVSIRIEKLTDLPRLRIFMEDNSIKLNKSEIARQMGVDRRTVSRYLDGFEKSKSRNKPSKLDSYYETIRSLLSSQTQVFQFRSVLYRYLKDNYSMDVPEQTFYHYLKTVSEFDCYFKRAKTSSSITKPVIRFETAPGEQVQFDWKESVPFVLRDTDEIVRINILVLILGHSRLRVYKPALNMTQDVLLHLMSEAFETLGGVPKTILTDNMKTVMDIARSNGSPGKPNAAFDAFCKDYGVELKPCMASHPQTKGKVESQMKFLAEIRAYSGKLNLVELFELIERINERINNSICRGTGKIPVIEFEKEKAFLQALPPESIRKQYKIETKSVKVNSAGMVNVMGNQYSVPSKYIGTNVNYQVHDSNIYVYNGYQLIATHTVSNKKLNYASEHYNEILSFRYINKNSDEVREMAKRNLDIIGGIYAHV